MMFVVPDEYDHTLPGSFFKGRERAYVATSSAPLANNDVVPLVATVLVAVFSILFIDIHYSNTFTILSKLSPLHRVIIYLFRE